jgi:hypothetical protein
MRRIGTSVWISLALVGLLSSIAAAPAAAQARAGVQGGMSLDPDQVFFGGHVQTSPLIENLRFRPGVDIGLGDDITLVGFNFDFTYTFTSRSPWNLYAGAGPAINWVDTDFGSDTEGGFNFLVGARQRQGMFFEMRVGVMDSPDLKFGVGYTF